MSLKDKIKFYNYDALMRYARRLGFGDIYTKIDDDSGLQAIIAVHSTKKGPAIGGCRFYPYQSMGHALKDVLRLSYMMTLKAAVVGLPHGGAKSVIMQPKVIKDRTQLFRSFGDFAHELNGNYIIAMDVGTTTGDMDIIAERTPHVIGAAGTDPIQCDPSPYTALGVFKGIQAAVKLKWDRDDLDGLHVVMQGAGKVAYELARLLHQRNVQLTVTDYHMPATVKFEKEFGATVVALEEIYDVAGDIFSPCAIGGTINMNSLSRLKTPIIAGSANNQLAHRAYAQLAKDNGFLYVPDYVINSGGLIQAASVHDYHDLSIANRLIESLYDRILSLLERSVRLNKSTVEVADLIAKEQLQDTELQATTV